MPEVAEKVRAMVRDLPGAPRTILVIRALQLGDLLCAVPALRALRAAFPTARVTLAGLPWAREFAARFRRYVDEFIEFPGFPGLPERVCDVGNVPRFLEAVQARRFDLALQMHGDGRLLNPLTALVNARHCAGYCAEGAYCPDRERFLPWRQDEHEVLRYTRLMRALGVPVGDDRLEFPITAQERSDWGQLAAEHGLERGSYVCVHPGSQLPSRRWPAARFAAVGDRLAEDGYKIVLTGTSGEAGLVQDVAATMHHIPVNLVGGTTLGVLAALVEAAALIVCNDTGVSHIAAAVGTPSVVICCGSDFRRWAPLDRDRHRVLHHPVGCRPCAYLQCPIGHPCATGVGIDEVTIEARRLIGSYRPFDRRAVCVG